MPERRPPDRRPSGRRPPRWWLAGLLVGCLLPAGLSPFGAATPVERVIQVCILAPALIRASSRLQARRRARRRWPSRPLSHRAGRLAIRLPLFVPRQRAVAAHDVLTRRGPPRVFLA
ncbi:hypothetical protein [Halomonas getboli]|uniref:hypothetical protein n=1 Tax=Halomonas getboli TaxID=2935862 RepID=UPI001FFF327F|nr:hypothetical protein [Halomonas getboli]MCK2182644.1 hypothetical protein [Halomonas getboli]